MLQSYYFDTDVLISYFDVEDVERNRISKNTIRKVKSNVGKT